MPLDHPAPDPSNPANGFPLIVCPVCQYGFPDRGRAIAEEYVCPRGECGHRWRTETHTLRTVYGAERRTAHPEIRVVAGATPMCWRLPEGETLVGRDAMCQFRLDNRGVSRRHARILRHGGGATIEDLSSAGGTLLNGHRIEGRHPLRACDELLIGGVVVQFAVRFEAASAAPEIVDSTALMSRAGSAPRIGGKAVEVIPLDAGRLTFGRLPDRDIVLPDAMISGRHAVLARDAEGTYLSDTQSLVGTFVNGRGIIRAPLEPGDRLQLGPYLFRFEGDRLVWVRQPSSFGVTAEHLVQAVGNIVLLDDISLALAPGEFVGLLGPSGAGKTTLLDALNGMRPAASGRVLVNGEPLYEQYDRLRHHIGYVPQEDIIHRELTVRQALTYAARLRLPPDLDPAEVGRLVEETLATLDLTHRADVRISRLSGGQRKRASVGVELLSKPGILYLDEPTSGLDPGTETRLMRRFRRLADQGRTVVCTTHVMENIDLFHKVVVLAAGGKLAWCGPPLAAKTWFGIEKFTLLYERMDEESPGEWQRRFRESATPPPKAGPPPSDRTAVRRRAGRMKPAPSPSLAGQWTTLASRFLALLWADKSNLALLAAQPLVIAGLIALVCRELPSIFFLLVISALWFGCSGAAQQIVKERPVYRRERMVNLRLFSYLLSKFLPLAAISAGQCTLMLLIVWLFEDFRGWTLAYLAGLWFAAVNGVATGLIISAVASNADKAMSVVPLSLIPQIILAGVLVPLPDMNVATRVVACLVASRWANQAMEVGLLEGRAVDADLLADRSLRRPLWNLYPDYELMEPEGPREFMADQADTRVSRTKWLAIDCLVLAAFAAGQLAMAAALLRRQDSF